MGLFGPPNIEKLEKNGNINKLIKALKYDDFFVKKDAIIALNRLRSKESVDYIIPFLEDSKFQEEASYALGAIGDKKSVKPLINRLINDLKGEPWPLIYATLVALTMLDEIDKVMQYYTNGAIGHAEEICAFIVPYAARKPEILIPYLSSDNWFIRRNAISILGDVEYYEAQEYFVKALNDDVYEVRSAAIYSLGKLHDESSIVPLLRFVDTELSVTLVYKAVDVLSKMKHDNILISFIRLVENHKLSIGYISDNLATTYKDRGELYIPFLNDKLLKIWESDSNYELFSVAKILQKIGWEPVTELDREYFNIALNSDNEFFINESPTKMRLKILGAPVRSKYSILPGEVPYLFAEMEKAAIVIDVLADLNSFTHPSKYAIIEEKRIILITCLGIIPNLKDKFCATLIRPLMRVATKNCEFALKALGLVEYLIKNHIKDLNSHDLKQLIKINSISYLSLTGIYDDGNPDLEFIENRDFDFTKFHPALLKEIKSREARV